MIKIEAIIRHFKLDAVKTALTAHGIHGMTVSEVRGFGRQRGHMEAYRGAEYAVDFIPKLKLEIVVSDEDFQPTVDILLRTARTGEVGDGKVLAYDLDEAVRVRTGETSDAAV